LAAISQTVAGPFAYAERFDEATNSYEGLVIEQGGNTPVVIDSDCVIVRPNVAEETVPNRPGKGKVPRARSRKQKASPRQAAMGQQKGATDRQPNGCPHGSKAQS
jgi:hypothetical protein